MSTPTRTSRMRIVLGNGNLARYPESGGGWCVRLQYLLSLRALNHDVMLLELLWSSGDARRDEERIRLFFERLTHYGLRDQCALVLFDKELDEDEQRLESARVYGKSMKELKETIKNADLLWNDCCGVRQPLLGMFRHRVLVDLDPGHLQVSCLTAGIAQKMNIYDHHAFLSVGKKLNDSDCEVPTLDLPWRTFTRFVYLPMWKVAPDPGRDSPFTSVTHWEWGELLWRDRVLSISKRDAYLRYAELPKRSGRPFELAADIYPDTETETDDRRRLKGNGWRIVHPWKVAGSPVAYQRYIAASRAEILCAKPIFGDLNTGWFSDRSAAYLASGRPVLAEETGFSDYLPVGKGLLAFRNLSEATAGVAEIDSNYPEHMRAARDLAEEFLDYRKVLPGILESCMAN